MYHYLNTSTNRKMSQLLAKKGCVSQSEWVWTKYWEKNTYVFRGELFKSIDYYPAFSFEDVIRRENSIRLWGEDISYSRTVLLDFDNGQSCTVLFDFDNGENGSNTYAIDDTQYEHQFQSHRLLDLFHEDDSGEKWQGFVISYLEK